MFCSNCGFRNNQGDMFCGACGMSLIKNNGVCKLTINRPKSFIGSLVKFKIFIDGVQVGTIKNGQTIVLDVNAGSHVISFNKTQDQNLNICGDTFVDVGVISSNKFGLLSIKDINGLTSQNIEITNDNVDKIKKTAKYPLYLSIICIILSFVLVYTVQKVVSPWVYGVSIGYSVINLFSLKKQKVYLNDKYKSLLVLNIVAILISIVGAVISTYFMI